MRGTYRNSQRSEKMIRQAVITILEKKKDLSLITVSDIVKEADINRGTFYNHYNNVQDVISEIEDELMSELSNVLTLSMNHNKSTANFVYTINNFLKEKEIDYKTIVPYIPRYVLNGMKEKIFTEIYKLYFNSNTIPNNKRILIFIIANGIAETYMDYFENRLNITLDELAIYLIKFLDTSLVSIK